MSQLDSPITVATAVKKPSTRPEGRLQRGWNKRPLYNFPPTIYSQQNTGGKQLDHMMRKVDQIQKMILDTSVPYDDIAHGIATLTSSLETFWRILERTRGRSYVQGVFNEVEGKYEQRGCYVLEDDANGVS